MPITLPKGFVLESDIKPPEGFVLEEPSLEPVLTGETQIDDLLPPEESQQLKGLLDLSDDPQRERENITNTLYFANAFFEDPDDVSLALDEIMEKTQFNPVKSKPEERGFFGKIAESYQRGDAEVMADISIYETAFEGRGDEITALTARKKLQMKEALDPIEGNFMAELVYSGVRVLPGMGRGYWSAIPQATVGMGIGALAALTAGQVPPLTLAPEEVGTVPAGAAIGLKAGIMVGSAHFWYKQGAGSMYATMRENDYDPEISKHIAGVAAIPYAIVEFLQVSALTPGMRRGALKVAQKSMLKVMGKAIKKYGTVWGTEVFEEVVQEIIQITAEDMSGYLSKKLKLPKGISGFLIERGRRLWETTKGAAKAMALLPIPGATIDVYTGKRSIVAVEKPPVEAVKEVKPVAPTEIETLAKKLEESLNLTPERALEVASKKLAYDAQKAAEIAKITPEPPVEAIAPEKPPTVPKKPPVKEISPIVEPELTKQEQVDIARLEAEIEAPFEMERVKDVGFVIKEKATGKEVAVIAKRKEAKARLAEFIKGEKRIRITRRKPKVLTDTTTVNKLVTEAQALKAAIKKAAQAARKAFAVGKAEGIAKVRAYYQELKVRGQARKELKGRIDKAVKIIRKSVPTSVDFFYREAIENLQAGIDPSFRTKKTLHQRERTREFLQRKPEALKDMPVKLLKKLQKKSIGEYTVAEIEQIAGEIERLKEQGKLKRKLRLTQKARKLEKDTAEIIETITRGEPIESEKEPVVYSTTKEGFIKTAWEKTKAWTWRPSRIFDMLDGVRDFAGKVHRIFIDQVNEATNAKLRMEDKRKDAAKAKMKELGIDYKDLAQAREIAGVKYTVQEMMGVYNANKNRLAKLAIMYGNNINEGTIAEIIANLTDAEKALGDFIVQDYDENYDRLRNEVIKVENRDMGYEENYTPIRRTEIDYTTHTEEIIDAILRKEALRKAYAEHGFTIKRKEVPAEFQKPIRLEAVNVWFEQIAKQEQYIHFADLVKDLHKIAGDKELRAAVEKQFGKEFNKIIRNYVDRVANPNIYKSYNSLENLSRRLRQHAVIAYLAYNLVTMAKQIPSVFLYLQDAGPTHLLSSAMEFVADPMKMIQMVREKDPQVKHRAIERELEELKARQPTLYGEMIAKFGRVGMEGIYLFDAIARTIGWNAVYQKALHNGMSEAEAVRQAQNATLRTQPAAAAKDVAQLYATNEFANWFTMFTNQLNQIYNIATYDFRGYLKNEDYRKAFLSMMGLGITSLMIWIITKRRLPESPEDFADAVAEQAINAVPLIGKAIMVGKKGWGDTEIPAFELPKAAGRAARKISEGKFDEKDLKVIAEGIAVTAGVPFIGPKRVVEMVTTGEVKELIGGEPIIKKGKSAKPIER